MSPAPATHTVAEPRRIAVYELRTLSDGFVTACRTEAAAQKCITSHPQRKQMRIHVRFLEVV